MARIVYTPEAVKRRLKMLDNLRRTCLRLAGPRLKWTWKPADGSRFRIAVPKMEKHKERRIR